MPKITEIERPDIELKIIPSFPKYLVSATGRVFREHVVNTHGEYECFHEISQRPDHNGYLTVGVMKEGKQYCKTIHRLVLESFSRPANGKEQGSHLNGIKTDNRIENLNWLSAKENINMKKEHGTMPLGANHFNSTLSPEDVMEMKKLMVSGMSQRKVAAQFSVSQRTAQRISNGTHWKG